MPETMQPPVPARNFQVQGNTPVPFNEGGAVPPAADTSADDTQVQIDQTVQEAEALEREARFVEAGNKAQNASLKLQKAKKKQQEILAKQQELLQPNPVASKKAYFLKKASQAKQDIDKFYNKDIDFTKFASPKSKQMAVKVKLATIKKANKDKLEEEFYTKTSSILLNTLNEKHLIDSSNFNSLIETGPYLITWALATKKAGKFVDFVNHQKYGITKKAGSSFEHQSKAPAINGAYKTTVTICDAITKVANSKNISIPVFLVKVAKYRLANKKTALSLKIASTKEKFKDFDFAIKKAYNIQYFDNVGYNALISHDTEALAKCVIGLALEGVYGEEARQEAIR